MTWTGTGDDSRIAALEATVAQLQQRVAALEAASAGGGAAYAAVDQPNHDAQDPWAQPPWPEVLGAIRAGKKIEAIKIYRGHTGVGLKEAKDIVEEVERRMG